MGRLAPPDQSCAMCLGQEWTFVEKFDRRPALETDFGIDPYYRELWQCGNCGHVINHHEMDLAALYSAAYWDKTYADKIRATYDKIMGLPADRSDNRNRAAGVEAYWSSVDTGLPKTLLDIGSGLAVFPAVMRDYGWDCTALDPDERAADHARGVAGVRGLTADFMAADINDSYALVSLNKVLEHVPDMVAMLARVHQVLLPGGVVYVELPDGEGALADSADREEFFIEHYCAFSLTSLAHLARRAGFRCDLIERLREPSGKYTLRAFLRGAR